MEELTVEQKYLERIKRARKRRQRRRMIKLVVGLMSVALVVLYFLSDSSHVKTLTVYDNYLYRDEEILKKAKLNYDSSFLLSNRFWIAYQLEKDPLIMNAKVSKDFKGGIHVTVEEKKVIGYMSEQRNQLIIDQEGIIEIDGLSDSIYENIARISGFNQEQMKQLKDSFNVVDKEIITMISEIIPYQTSYNDDMVQLVMRDGNRISTTYRGIALVNHYKKILPQLEGTHVCLYADEYTESIFKETIDCKPTK